MQIFFDCFFKLFMLSSNLILEKVIFMIKFLIQSTFIKESEIQKKFSALQKLSIPVMDFGVIPSEYSITNLENILIDENDDYVFLCSILLLKIIDKATSLEELCPFLSKEQLDKSDIFLHKLKNAVFYDFEKFDQAYYSQLDLPLLNKDCLIITFNEALNLKFNEDMFVKPSTDLKVFNGGFIAANTTFSDFLKTQKRMSNIDYSQVNIIFSPIKKVFSEYRFFVVDKTVVSGSRYMVDRVVKPNSFVPDDIWNKAEELSLIYQPADIFTLDLCYTDHGIFIVEYNCFNCSGSYDNDLVKTYQAIHNFLLSKKN